MPETGLIVEDLAQVRTLRLNRPALHNAFDSTLIAALTAALLEAGIAPGVRVVVLTGTGKSFSAGADLQWMRAMAQASELENQRDAWAMAQLMRTLDELPKPTIARVNGAAYGGGVGLIACCDIAIGCAGAHFGLTESRLGLLPAVISPYVIAAIGPRQARRWFTSAESFNAMTAQTMGLLHQLVAADQLEHAVQHQIRLLLAAAPQTGGMAKTLIRAASAGQNRDTLDRDNAALIARLRVSPEGQEGLGAFLDKRAPAWLPQDKT